MSKKISYTNRDFANLRQDLVKFTRDYYPDLIQNTNDASIYSVLIDLNAAIADNLHHHIDRVWQETMLDFAQQRRSLFHIAKTYGLKLPSLKPSTALCDFSITVPVRGDKDDERYLGVLRSGTQVFGGGQTFETITDIDFSSPFNERGEPNRLKLPNYDNNNRLVSYTITKREPVVNGVTKIFRKVITRFDQKPFLKIYLPEQNVLGVSSIIHKEGINYLANPSNTEFINSNNKWYEVPSLIEDKVFVPNKSRVVDMPNMVSGEYIKVNNKFITEYTPEGYFLITFGSGSVDPLTNLTDFVENGMKVNLSNYLNNFSLGAIPKEDTTIFIKYRVGGGKDTNLGIGVLNTLNNLDFFVDGPNIDINNQVTQSLSVINVTPAVGGSDQPTIEELRNMISYNFSAQNRAVTLNDYKSLIETMPSLYGAPAKVNVIEEDNKVKINLLSYDETGNLTSIVSSTLKQNILNYLSNYRMINDYIEIDSAEVIDLGLEIDLFLDQNQNQSEVIREIIQTSTQFFSIDKRKLGEPFFVGELMKVISNIFGVINVVDIRVFNKVGGEYSTSEVSQEYLDSNSRLVKQQDMTIFMKANQTYQVRFPNRDIKVRVKTITKTTF